MVGCKISQEAIQKLSEIMSGRNSPNKRLDVRQKHRETMQAKVKRRVYKRRGINQNPKEGSKNTEFGLKKFFLIVSEGGEIFT